MANTISSRKRDYNSNKNICVSCPNIIQIMRRGKETPYCGIRHFPYPIRVVCVGHPFRVPVISQKQLREDERKRKHHEENTQYIKHNIPTKLTRSEKIGLLSWIISQGTRPTRKYRGCDFKLGSGYIEIKSRIFEASQKAELCTARGPCHLIITESKQTFIFRLISVIENETMAVLK